MTFLKDHLTHYIQMRRGFGYEFSTAERILKRFVAFATEERTEYVTTALFLKWKQQCGSANERTWATRLGIVRMFAIWLQALDARHEVPPQGIIVARKYRPRPFIYSPNQIIQIITTAAQLPSAYGLRGLTCSTLLGLIAVTGLRISEAIGLDDEDVDLTTGVLTVRNGKNGTSRILPISESTSQRLRSYRRERNRLGKPTLKAYFQCEQGERPTDCGVRYNFAQISQQIGLREPTLFQKHGRGPRIHDLRHTFAVRTMMNWYREGRNPDQEMPKLSAYLGHAVPEHTYWYLEAVPALLELASERACHAQIARTDQ